MHHDFPALNPQECSAGSFHFDNGYGMKCGLGLLDDKCRFINALRFDNFQEMCF